MSTQRIKGAAQKTIDAAKLAAGKAIGNEKLRVEGLVDEVVGTAKETLGKTKDVPHKAAYGPIGPRRRRRADWATRDRPITLRSDEAKAELAKNDGNGGRHLLIRAQPDEGLSSPRLGSGV